MIKLLRVDDRLLHGQVAFAWTRALDADCILLASDALVHDEFRKTTVAMAKPEGVKLVIKNIDDSIKSLNSGVTDKYKLFIIVENVTDAVRLSEGAESVKSINLGGIRPKPGSKAISQAVSLTDEEIKLLHDAQGKGTEVYIQQVPVDKKESIK